MPEPSSYKPTSMMAGMHKEGTVEDVNANWGERRPARWTYGSSARTRALTVLEQLHYSLEALAAKLKERAEQEGRDPEQVPDVRIPGILAFNESLCQAWSGEGGRDTGDYIKAVGAARGQAAQQEPQGP